MVDCRKSLTFAKFSSHTKLPSEVKADSVRLSLPDPFVNRLRIAHVRKTSKFSYTRGGSERGLSPPVRLFDEHRVAKGEESVFLLYRKLVGLECILAPH